VKFLIDDVGQGSISAVTAATKRTAISTASCADVIRERGPKTLTAVKLIFGSDKEAQDPSCLAPARLPNASRFLMLSTSAPDGDAQTLRVCL
jgi:hypothetical protein